MKSTVSPVEINESQESGLLGEDFGLLNTVSSLQRHPDSNYPCGYFDQLLYDMRIKYASNPMALEELDTFDPKSEYSKKHEEQIVALKIRDEVKLKECEVWFLEHYPLTTEPYSQIEERLRSFLEE